MFKFYLPVNHPSDLTSPVGGAITSTEYGGQLGDLFIDVVGPPPGAAVKYQHRKLFIKNESGDTRTEVKVWLEAVEHLSQIQMAVAVGNDQFSNSTTLQPSYTWVSPANYLNGLSLPSLEDEEYAGIWIRQRLQNISQGDPYSSFRIVVGAL